MDQAADQPGPIEKHDILMIQLGDDESGLSSVRVGQDGTVEVPGRGSIKADGLTLSHRCDQIAGKLRENGADTKTVAVKRVGPSDAAAAPSNDVKPPSDESKPAPSTDNQAHRSAQKQQ